MQDPYRQSARPEAREVRIASFGAPHEAEMARGYLESEGIACRLKDDILVGAALGYESAFGGIKLFVDAADAELAFGLLESYRCTSRTHEPALESHDQRVRRAFRASLLAFIVFPVGLHLFSLHLLLAVRYGELDLRGRKLFVLSHLLNWSVLLGLGWIIFVRS